MIYVKKLNVVKRIDESRLAEYEGKGFAPISETPEPRDEPGDEPCGATRFFCPHCDKDYATAENLASHIKNKHPEMSGQ